VINVAKLNSGKASLTRSIAAIVAITFSSISVAFADGHLSIDNVSVQFFDSNSKVRVTVETAAAIPTDGASGAFGYAVLTESGNGPDLSLGNALVLVTHLGLDDSGFEDPISGFHTHVLDLMPPTSVCSGASLEVDLVGSGDNRGFDLNTYWSVVKKISKNGDRNVANIGRAPIRLLNSNPKLRAPKVEAVAAFTVEPRTDGPDLHLCVFVIDAVTP
jgi:hypothetical protein